MLCLQLPLNKTNLVTSLRQEDLLLSDGNISFNVCSSSYSSCRSAETQFISSLRFWCCLGFIAIIHIQMSCHLLRAFREGHAVLLRGHFWILKDLLEHTPSIFNQMVSYWSNQCRGAPERFVLCCVQQQPANQIPIACQVPAVLVPILPFCHLIFLAALWNGYYNPRLTTGKLETQRCKLDAYSSPQPPERKHYSLRRGLKLGLRNWRT